MAYKEMLSRIKEDEGKNLDKTTKWLQEQLIETFKDSALNQCETQKLQMLKGTYQKTTLIQKENKETNPLPLKFEEKSAKRFRSTKDGEHS